MSYLLAVPIYRDKDNDGKLNSFFGIPTEEMGISNNPKGGFGPPKRKDAKLQIKQLAKENHDQNIQEHAF